MIVEKIEWKKKINQSLTITKEAAAVISQQYSLSIMKKRNSLLVGLPVILLVVAGSYGLSQFVQGKIELGTMKQGKKVLTQREYDLEEDYKKTMAKLNPEKRDYNIVPIPRPASLVNQNKENNEKAE